jgi:hypothetical protein
LKLKGTRVPAPTASAPGYGLFRGRVACDCLIAWLPKYERELQRRGIIGGPLPIAQLVGDAPASAGTHYGGAFDLRMTTTAAVWIARAMGADATWVRDWPGNLHIHGVLTACPHNGNARYQIDAVRAGFNGLGTNGRGGPDDGPRPLSGRTWRQGLDWQHRQEDWFDMATRQDLTEVVANQLAPLAAQLNVLVDRTEGLRVTLAGIVTDLDALEVEVADDATKDLVRKMRDQVIAALSTEPA